MNNLFLYLAQSSACLLGFYLFYFLLLKMETGFQFNRLYLLITPLLSGLIPLLKIPMNWLSSPLPPIYEGGPGFTVMATSTAIMVEAKATPFNWTPIILGIYLTGLFVFTFLFFRQLLTIRNFIRHYQPETQTPDGIKIINTQGQLPTFSFLHYLFWDNSQNLNEQERQKIIQHETVHIYQKHTWDLLYLEVLTLIFWFNPVIHLYKRALASIHEFIADAVVIKFTNQEDYSSLLVKQVFEQVNLSLGHFFSKSLTLKRMQMLRKNHLRPNRLKQLLALPLLGLLLFLFSFENASVAEIIENPSALVNAGTTPSDPIINENGVIAPLFPGGKSEMNRFLRRNIKYPLAALKNKETGTVNFMIRIDKNGHIELADRPMKGAFAAEIDRLVKMMPRWQPATKNGSPVESEYYFTFNFALNGFNAPEIKEQPAFPNGKTPAFVAEPVNIVGYSDTPKPQDNLEVLSTLGQTDNLNKLPAFPGGRNGLRTFLSENAKYPATALKNKISGQAIIQANIDADGKLGNFKTLHTDHPSFEQEAVSVLQAMPRWEPGEKAGKTATYTLIFPFVFGLESNRNLPALRLPANRSQLYVQEAINIVGYSQVIPGKTFVKKSVTPSGNNLKTDKVATVSTKPAPAAKENIPPKTNSPAPSNEPIFTFVEQQPIFKGGEQEMNKFIKANLKYPVEALRNGVSGLVVLQFTVDKTGKVLDPKVVKSLGAGTDEEAIRVIQLMPDFVPAKQKGKPVNFRYTLPIRFGLTSNTTSATPDAPETERIFTFVEQQPSFPGGDLALHKFVKQELKYPENALSQNTEGLVVVQFIVDENGKISNPKVVKSLGFGFDQEALRVVKLMPTFRPARQNGRPVSFRYTLPIRFALATEAEPKETGH